MLFGVSPKERAEETGISKSSLYAKANLFDQAGMASLLPPVPPPEIPKQDKRTLPPPVRQAIVDAKAEHPGLSLHEIARICYVQFNRRPSHHTIQLVLASGPKPSRTTRRFPRFDEMGDPAERRRVIIRLHADGWMPQSIAEYLGTSRQTVHTTLRRWAEEQFAGLEDKPHTRKRRALKTDLKAMNVVKRLQVLPDLSHNLLWDLSGQRLLLLWQVVIEDETLFGKIVPAQSVCTGLQKRAESNKGRAYPRLTHLPIPQVANVLYHESPVQPGNAEVRMVLGQKMGESIQGRELAHTVSGTVNGEVVSHVFLDEVSKPGLGDTRKI
ncbi:MAG TPA: helix-turn-helix domain-containing protein [Ktedonobacteraceae bacterium]|nr:helix-turn-helix domain-containing protein [Ktedonobacteraceae bacterium]